MHVKTYAMAISPLPQKILAGVLDIAGTLTILTENDKTKF